jgi:hypothetical protein
MYKIALFEMVQKLKTTFLVAGICAISNTVLCQDNKICPSKVYRTADILPKLMSPVSEIDAILQEELEFADGLKSRFGIVAFSFIINCHGAFSKPRLLKMSDEEGNIIKSDFDFYSSKIFELLQKNLRWAPAQQNGDSVNFYFATTVRFNYGKIEAILK